MGKSIDDKTIWTVKDKPSKKFDKEAFYSILKKENNAILPFLFSS